MPPSPSLRRSPRGDPRNDSHKRGRSLESGLSFKEKDDDLALFNEMQSKESENFLLQSTDDFEDLLSSKMKSFPDLKLGISIPARGESSDLLNADGDKNDYEWLLTPPETPLFPSLDDEPPPVNLVHSGRARSQPITLSRSSTMERNQRSSRGSPSPQRLSPSPRSGTSPFHGRPSSAPQSSPVPLRPSTPSRRPSPPPSKPSTPPPRSLTPTSRRTTAVSAGSLGTRGSSPVRTSRGNSASPKVKAWQSSIPGFSLEAPPNLRTSLADRPASYVRGSSPASRTSRDSTSKFGRQSMSPTPSRSISSSHSQERDRLSSHSKGSVVSSADDDVDSLQSAPESVSELPMSRKGVSGYPSGRPSVYSKKSTKTFSPSSAPKRSFDSAMRQMDRKSPQNMFRPLLSSVPSSTFHAGKSSSTHHTMISRNSSVTTSSNASSDQAISGAHDNEGSDQYHDDMASGCVRATFSDIHDEVFAFDKMDVEPHHIKHEGHDPLFEYQLCEPDKECPLVSNTGDSEASNRAVINDASDAEGDFGFNHVNEIALVCSRCGSHYQPSEMAENEYNICPECKQKKELVRSSDLSMRLETSQDNSVPLIDIPEESHVAEPKLDVPQSEKAMGIALSRNVSQIGPHEDDSPESRHPGSQPSQSCLDISSVSIKTESMLADSKLQVAREHKSENGPSNTDDISMEMQNHSDKTDMNIDIVEHAGISLLLNRSSSVKGPIIHGRTINSGAISYEDLTYARDLTSSMRSSIGHGSVSTSSSIDFTSARHGEMLVRRQLGCKLSDSSSKSQSTVSSLSGTSALVYQGLGLSISSHEGSFEGSVSNVRHKVSGDRPTSSSDEIVSSENIDPHKAVPSGSKAPMIQEDNNVYMSASEKETSLMAGYMLSNEVQDRSQASLDIPESLLNKIDENSQKCVGSPRTGESTRVGSSLAREGIVLDNRVDEVEGAEDLPQCSSSTISVIEINDSHPSSPRSQIDVVSRDDLEDPLATSHRSTDVKDTSPDSVQSDPDRFIEESTVTMEDQGGRRTRSLTLEEATDTILFCSSIIHDLAYKAANIAIEKEKENLEPLEGSRPTITIPDKRISDRQDHRGFTVSRTPKPQKAKKRRTSDTEAKAPLTENDERSNEPVVHNVGLPNKGDSMKPPKLESKCNCTIM